MGLDYGTKTIGVAISDGLGWTAQGIETITRRQESDLKPSIARLIELCEAYDVHKIIVGLPKNMDNTEGERVRSTEYFVGRLSQGTEIPIEYVDERLSTISADRILEEGDVRRDKRKEHIDKIAACFILQSYLDTVNNQKNENI
jgi:putative Holliday junction resolvase